MNVRASLLNLALGALIFSEGACAQNASGQAGKIVFHDGDELTGTLAALNTESGALAWTYPETKALIHFHLDAISHVVLRPSAITTTTKSNSQPQFKVTLTNGDALAGAIHQLDEEALILEAGFPEKLTIPRRHIRTLSASLSSSQLLYDGPKGPNEWEVGYRGKNWVYNEGKLVSESYSSTGRTLNIPDRARIELDVSLRNDPTLNLFLCADNPRNGGDSYYYLQLTPNVINCQRYWRDHPRTYINLTKEYENHAAKNLFLGQPQVHLAIEIDRQAKRLKLFINGELYATYRDPAPNVPPGSSMILASYGNGAVRAESIRVYRLDRLTAAESKSENGTVSVRGGHAWEGALTINDGTIHVEDQTAPLEQMLAASISAASHPPPNNDPSDIVFFLTADGRLTSEAHLDEDHLILRHDLLGNLKVPRDRVEGFIAPSATPQKVPSSRTTNSKVFFKNGDRLGGALIGWDDDRGLRWRWSDRPEPLSFPSRAIAEVHLTPERELPPNDAIIHLTSGDALPGTLSELTPDRLVANTQFSDPMRIPVPVIRGVAFQAPSSLYFRGPGPLETWKPYGSDIEWEQDSDGALVGKGSGGVGQAIPMPERGRLDVELSWKGQLDVSLTLFGRELHRAVQPRTYRLHCENERISLYRGLTDEEVAPEEGGDDDPLRNRRLEEQLRRFSAQFGGGATKRLGSPVSVRFQPYKRTRKIALCWDRSRATLALLVNGELLRIWEDPDGLVPPMKGLIMHQHSQTTTLRVLSVEVSDWNGVLPEPPLSKKETKALTQYVVRLQNQDQFLANTLAMATADAPLIFDSPIGRLALPVTRLEHLQFPQADYPIEHRLGMVVDGHLAPTGQCRFFLSQIENRQIEVTSPYFGENTFELGAFRKLIFDLQDRQYWDRQTLPWPASVPVSMRPTVQAREAAPLKPDGDTTDHASKYNESVEFDE